MKKRIFLLSFFLLIVLTLASCNKKNSDAEDAQAIYTQAAATVAAQLTEMAEENIQPTSTNASEFETEETPTKTTTPSPTAGLPTATKVQATVSGACSNVANFVEDVNYPDGTNLAPGEAFTKTWKMINNGTCTWNSNYSIVYISGSDLGAAAETPLTTGIEVPAGALINISVNLVAPQTEGEHTAYFKFKTASGTIFGINSNGQSNFYVKINVVKATSTPTKTSVPTATVAPTATVEPTITTTP
jgi:hypothetical protein